MAKRPRGIPEAARTGSSKIDPEVGASHPINNAKNADKLIAYLKIRLDFGKNVRDALATRFAAIDKEYNGYTELDKDDTQRHVDRMKGTSIAPTKIMIPFTSVQVDDFVTYAMSIVAPDSGMFQAIATRDKQAVAKGFSLDMNRSAEIFNYYTRYMEFFTDAMKYNLAWIMPEWNEVFGTKLSNNIGGSLNVQVDKPVWSGNSLQVLDVYNTLFDATVHPCDLHLYGEFVAVVETISAFGLRKGGQEGVYKGIERFFNEDGTLNNVTNVGGIATGYYEAHPRIRGTHESGGNVNANGKVTDWLAFAGDGAVGTPEIAEKITIFIRLIPAEFNLSLSRNLEIWRFVLINSSTLVHAEKMANAHNMLPVLAAMPRKNNLGFQVKSYAEMLNNLQMFANYLLNLHIESARKKLYGVTIYNPDVIPLGQVNGQVMGFIPMVPGTNIDDLRKHVLNLADVPDTSQTMNDLANTLDLMQRVLPTDMLRQVADLQRATQYQAAAAVQGGSRKQYTIFQTIHNQALVPLRYQLVLNTMQFRQQLSMLDSEGNQVTVDPAQYRDAQLEFSIGDGMKGIDKLALTSWLRDIINTLIQSQQAIQEIDIVAFLDYFTSLIGDKTDLAQFRKKIPTLMEFTQQLPPELQQVIAPMVQQIYATASRAEGTPDDGQSTSQGIPAAIAAITGSATAPVT